MIPAAGLGTRFLPATKELPKELLPVLDRPVIQWAVEEAVASGADEIVLVLAEGKEALAAHLRPDLPLERLLEERGKFAELEAVRRAGNLCRITVARQTAPRGLGDAVLCAADAVGERTFLCMLPDDLSVADPPLLRQLWGAHEQIGTSILALMRVPGDQISRYGCAEIGESRGKLHRVQGLVEKPRPGEAKSDLAVMGRYILTPGDLSGDTRHHSRAHSARSSSPTRSASSSAPVRSGAWSSRASCSTSALPQAGWRRICAWRSSIRSSAPR